MAVEDLEARIQAMLKQGAQPQQRGGLDALEARIQATLAGPQIEGPPIELADPNQLFIGSEVDEEKSLPLATRLKAQTSPNQTGKINALIDSFGEENVRVLRDPETQDVTGIYARENPEQKFRPLDPDTGFFGDIPGDIVDIVPDVAEAALGIAGTIGGTAGGASLGSAGAVSGGILGGAAADAASAVGRAKIAEAIGADPEMTAGDIAKLAAFNVGTGLLGEGVQGAFRGGRALLMPRARLQREIAKQAGGKAAFKEAAQEGLNLSRRTGVNLNLAQATGASAASRVQGELSSKVGDFPIAQAADKSLRQFQNFTEKTIKALARGGGKVSRTEAGERAAKAISQNLDTLVKERSARFGGALEAAQKQSGGEAVISLKNFEKTIDDEIAQITSTPGARATRVSELRYLKNIKKDLSNFRPKGDGKELSAAVSPSQINNQLKDLIEASDFLKKPKTMQTRGDTGVSRIAKRLLGATQKDLTEAVESGVPGAGALRQARDEFASLSKKITERKSQLAKSALKAVDIEDVSRPEVVVKKFAAAEPEEFSRTIAILDEVDPGAARDIRRAAIDEIFEGSKRVSDTGDLFVTPEGVESLFKSKKARRFILGMAENNKKAARMLNDLRTLSKKLQTRSFSVASGSQGFFGLAQRGARLSRGDITAAVPSTNFLLRKERFLKMMSDPKQWSVAIKLMDPPKSWLTSPGKAALEVSKALSRLEALQLRQDALDSGLFGGSMKEKGDN